MTSIYVSKKGSGSTIEAVVDICVMAERPQARDQPGKEAPRHHAQSGTTCSAGTGKSPKVR
jgi:hypothetical protein